jgi:hypothetical protein
MSDFISYGVRISSSSQPLHLAQGGYLMINNCILGLGLDLQKAKEITILD